MANNYTFTIIDDETPPKLNNADIRTKAHEILDDLLNKSMSWKIDDVREIFINDLNEYNTIKNFRKLKDEHINSLSNRIIENIRNDMPNKINNIVHNLPPTDIGKN